MAMTGNLRHESGEKDDSLIRVLVVERDRSLRTRLRIVLSAYPDVELLPECASPVQAKSFITDSSPDLLFLDLQSADLHCVAEELSESSTAPLVVLVAPDERYAFKAIKMHVFDYLVKPINDQSLLETVAQAIANINRRCADETERRASKLFGSLRSGSIQDRLIIKSGGRLVFVKADDIDWIKAERNYVRIFVGNEAYLERQSISSMESRLDSSKFVRIHRSVIVNLEKIRELRPWPTGEYVVLMRNGKELTLSRGYRSRLQFLLGGPSESSKTRRLEEAAS